MVFLDILPGGAMTEKARVLLLSAKKGTWWLTPLRMGMYVRHLWQVHQMIGG
jgi:hypothetical protein